MNPSKNQGLRLTSKYTEGLAEDPSQREGPLGIDLRRGQTSSALFHMPQAGTWKAVGPEPQAPYLAGLYICTTQPIVFIHVGILKWLYVSESPHTVPTQNLSVFQTSFPAQMAGMWLLVYFRAAVCCYKA